MIEYLQKFGGYTSTGLTIDEKKELESLRLQVKKYRALEETKTEEEKSETKEENQSESDDEDDVDPELDNIVNKIKTIPFFFFFYNIISFSEHFLFHSIDNDF